MLSIISGRLACVRDGCDGFDIQNVQQRIADGLAVNHARARRDGAAEILRIVRIDENGVDPQPPEAHVELRVRAAVQILGRDDLVALRRADSRSR